MFEILQWGLFEQFIDFIHTRFISAYVLGLLRLFDRGGLQMRHGWMDQSLLHKVPDKEISETHKTWWQGARYLTIVTACSRSSRPEIPRVWWAFIP